MARLTTQTDIDTYNPSIIAEGQTPMQLNDVIFFIADDRNPANGNLFDQTVWTGARNGATIWIEGGVEAWQGIDIGTQSSTDLTVPSDASNPSHVHFFNGQGKVFRGTGGLSGREMQFYNFDYLIIDFETNTNPGLRDGWGSGRTNTFGLKIQNIEMTKGGMALKVDNTRGTMKRLEIRGCELTVGSFAKIRTILSENHLEKLLIERNLFTRSVGGEGVYSGQTTRLPGDDWNSIVYTIRNNIFAFTAAEGLQLMQAANGSRIHNNVMFVTGHDYKAAFQPFQDTGVQLDMVQGDVRFYNNIIFGHGTSGIQVFAKDGSLQTPQVLWGNETPKIYNNLIGGAKKGIAYRINESFKYGPGITFRDNDISDPQRNYQEIGDIANYYAEIPNSVTPVTIIGGSAPDDANTYLNEARSNDPLRGMFNVTRQNVETPQFINSGFNGIDVHKISRWSELYEVGHYWGYSQDDDASNVIDMSTLGSTHTFNMFQSTLQLTPGQDVHVSYRDAEFSFYAKVQSYSGATKTLVLNTITNKVGTGTSVSTQQWDVMGFRQCTAGEFVWLAEDEEQIPMHLYKCLVSHQSIIASPITRRPDQNSTYWELVWWDVDGRNQYDPLYNGIPFTNDFMQVAGDFRLVKNSYHHLKGRGLECNEQRDDQTMMGWQWKQSDAGTVRDIPGAYKDKLRISDYSYLKSGRYYRFWVEKKKSDGTFETRVYSDWQQIP